MDEPTSRLQHVQLQVFLHPRTSSLFYRCHSHLPSFDILPGALFRYQEADHHDATQLPLYCGRTGLGSARRLSRSWRLRGRGRAALLRAATQPGGPPSARRRRSMAGAICARRDTHSLTSALRPRTAPHPSQSPRRVGAARRRSPRRGAGGAYLLATRARRRLIPPTMRLWSKATTRWL